MNIIYNTPAGCNFNIEQKLCGPHGMRWSVKRNVHAVQFKSLNQVPRQVSLKRMIALRQKFIIILKLIWWMDVAAVAASFRNCTKHSPKEVEAGCTVCSWMEGNILWRTSSCFLNDI